MLLEFPFYPMVQIYSSIKKQNKTWNVYERNGYVNAQKKILKDTYQIYIHKICTVFKATEEKVACEI